MSSRPHFRSILLTAVAGVAVAACSDNATGPSPQTLDLATLLGEMSPASVSAATTFAMSAAGPMLVVTSPFDPTQCVYSAETGFFVCPTRTLNGVAVTRMYRLIDAAGNSQSKFDAQTAALETKMTVKGTPTSQSQFSTVSNVTIDGRSDMTLSGIRTNVHTLNGLSSTTLTGSFDLNGTAIPINTTMTETTTNLVLPNANAGQKWPQSGTMTFDETSDVVSTITGTPETTRVVIAFNGTSIVTVTITNAFGTSTCHFDMANPGVAAGACS